MVSTLTADRQNAETPPEMTVNGVARGGLRAGRNRGRVHLVVGEVRLHLVGDGTQVGLHRGFGRLLPLVQEDRDGDGGEDADDDDDDEELDQGEALVLLLMDFWMRASMVRSLRELAWFVRGQAQAGRAGASDAWVTPGQMHREAGSRVGPGPARCVDQVQTVFERPPLSLS